jgi:hypothetical protein
MAIPEEGAGSLLRFAHIRIIGIYEYAKKSVSAAGSWEKGEL